MNESPFSFAICINRRLGGDKSSCASRGSEKMADALEAGVRERGIDVQIERLVCFGLCTKGPNMRRIPGGDFLHNVTMDDIARILDELEEECGVSHKNGDILSIPGS